MARNFRELEAKMGPERIARSNERVKQMLAEMPLAELREARQMTQTTLAEILQVNQPAISKIERQTDMYISTLRSFVSAMGGRLRLEAIFPEGSVEIKQFEEPKPQAKRRQRKAVLTAG
jgi:DNA-binding XRE family transcriptional regulator